VARKEQLTALIEREGDGYVSLCPELDIASQGESVEEARLNLIEALELFFESASPTEVARRLSGEAGSRETAARPPGAPPFSGSVVRKGM
jgi:predicted RNase H-like HicB family nuclease